MDEGVTTDLRDWPPENQIFPINSVDIRIKDGEHPYVSKHRSLIEQNWRSELAAKPKLFDGPLVFHHRLTLTDGALTGEALIASFSVFLFWRKQADRSGGLHLFCYPVIESCDGALIAIRMGEHTANPGQVYFAAGSLDLDDVCDGKVDVDGNMRREVLEETGLDLDAAETHSGYYASHDRGAVCLCRVFRFALTADELAEKIRAHLLVSHEDEVSEVIVIRSGDAGANTYNSSMLPILNWYFGNR